MKIKELRKSMAIFLTGIIIGISIGPLTDKNPQQVIISPISLTLAETKDFIVPLEEGEVLGIIDEQKEISTGSETEDKEENIINYSQFASLVNQTIGEKPNNTETESTRKDKIEVNQSSYSGTITIAALGDSMTDLMGPDLPYLKKYLKTYYPKAEFNFLNYGVGAENIEMVSARMDKEYDYQGRHYQSLISLNPNLIILESCAYNPFVDEGDYLNRHWTALSRITDIIKSQTQAKIIILATIAPSKEKFGEGPAGVNWPKDMAWQHANRINQYLDNTVRFAQAAGFPLVDVYHQTLLSNGEGNPAYINPGDHIHQNVAGDELINQLLAQKIFSLKIF